MIYLEDYDLPVIALNVNMYMTGLLFIFTDIFSSIIDLLATGEAWGLGFGSSLLYVLAVFLMVIEATFTILVDIWWIRRKSWDNRRWL